MAELGDDERRNNARYGFALAAIDEGAALRRVATASINEDVRVHEHARPTANVGQIHCSKKSASIEARNCSGVRVSGSVSNNRARPMRSDARDLLRWT